MRIGIDATSWANGRGYGRFLRQVLPGLVRAAPGEEFVCFLDAESRRDFPGLPGVQVREVPLQAAPTRAASAEGYRSPRDLLRMHRAVARARLDVFFAPTVYTWFPLPLGLPSVVTIHDAIVERFPELTIPGRRARLFWTLKVRLALAQATRVLTVSDFAADDLVRVLGVRRDRLRVAPEAPAPVFTPSPADEVRRAGAAAGVPAGAQWIIYVGGFNPHKRLDVLLESHAAAARATPVHLLLVGSVGSDVFHEHRESLLRSIATLGTGPLVHWTGFVPDEELRHLYTGAVACILPSEAEGFGLPAVEAAACATPVVATTESPLPQLLDGGGIWVLPGDRTALTEAIRRLVDHPEEREALGSAALIRARALSWDRTAAAVLGAIREAVGA